MTLRRLLPIAALTLVGAASFACGSSNPLGDLPDAGSNPPPNNDAGNPNSGGDSGPIGSSGGDDSGSGNGGSTDSGSGGGTDSGSGSGSDSGGNDASSSGGSAHGKFPILIDQGGPVMTAPLIITVTFPGDANKTTYETYGATATNNAYWDAIRQGYCETGAAGSACVGDGPAGKSVALTTAPKAAYTDAQDPTAASTIKTFIESEINSGKFPAPTADGNTLYAIYFPSTTTITLNGNATSCTQFGGYHNSYTHNGTQYTYAIIPECAAPKGSKLTQLQNITLAASHEFIEAATDPYATASTAGYYLNFNDPSILPWNNVGGGESGDMCVDFLGLDQDATTEAGFTVQRIWNNAQAALGKDPCVPAAAAGTTPYFNAAPEKWVIVTDVSTPTSVVLDGFSDAAIAGGWTVTAIDLNQTQANPNPYVTFSFAGNTEGPIDAGGQVTVGITLNQDPGPLAQSAGGAEIVFVSYKGASLQTATAGHLWPALVTSPASSTDAGFDGVDASTFMPRDRYIGMLQKVRGMNLFKR